MTIDNHRTRSQTIDRAPPCVGFAWAISPPTVIALLLLGGCAGPNATGKGLLPKVTAQNAVLADYQPDRPIVPAKEGVATRTTFLSAAAGYTIEVRDIWIAPSDRPTAVEISGGAFEVREGTGVVSVAGKTREVSMGATFAVSEGETLTVQARRGPLALRAHLFVGQ